MFGTDILTSLARPKAPSLQPMAPYSYKDFDISGALGTAFKSGATATNQAADAMNESILPGGKAMRSENISSINDFAKQLLAGGLSDAERGEINNSSAELTNLGFGGGFGSGMDALSRIRMRGDTIRGKQLQGAGLLGQNTQLMNQTMVNPSQLMGEYVSSYLNSQRADYEFNRNANYGAYLNNYNVQNQNASIKYQNKLATDPLYNASVDFSNTVTWAANTFGGAMMGGMGGMGGGGGGGGSGGMTQSPSQGPATQISGNSGWGW